MTRPRSAGLALATFLLLLPHGSVVGQMAENTSRLHVESRALADGAPGSLAAAVVTERTESDLEAMRLFRPGYTFWRHVFAIPDGNVAYGSGEDGRLLAVFPSRGDWTRTVRWEEAGLTGTLGGERLEPGLTARRRQVAELLEPQVGPVVHNATRGDFLLPNLERYGGFLDEWGRIFERFGVPAELGLAQAMIESGLDGRIRSEARALGFCQWLPRNWSRLKALSPHEIEGYNQTTQAPYCAAYLTILAAKYGTFIAALSEHHAGGTNVGRTVINGGWIGGTDPRERYLLGSAFARDLRDLAPRRYRDVVRTYGPRSFLYAEMVFGVAHEVVRLREEIPQVGIHAMRTPRALPLDQIVRRTGLSADQVRRFNPALVRRVPAGATLYLPERVEEFGEDVAFWHRPPDPAFGGVMDDFLTLQAGLDTWEDPAFVPVLVEFGRRFRETRTEEGTVMATVLAYAIQEMETSGRREILQEFRTDPRIRSLVDEGLREREAAMRESATAR